MEYKFLNGNAWGTEESAPATCTVGGSNRIFTVPGSDLVLPAVLFGACPDVVVKKKITFRVDMTGQTISANGVHVAGNFQGWNPGATALTLLGNNIYEIQSEVLGSILAVQYKFLNGNAWGVDESVSGACANSSSNRVYDISLIDSLVLPAYQFGTCTITQVTGLDKALEVNQFSVYPTRATDFLKVELGLATQRQVGIEVLDLAGRVVLSQNWGEVAAGQSFAREIEVSNLPVGLYLLRMTGLSGAVSARFQVAR